MSEAISGFKKELSNQNLKFSANEALCFCINLKGIDWLNIDPGENHLNSIDFARFNELNTLGAKNKFLFTKNVTKALLYAAFGNNIDIKIGLFGKPFISSQTGEFNISHSKDFLLIAICLQPIGVDIEYVQKIYEQNLIQAHLLHPKENIELSQMPLREKLEGFYRCWVRKESLVKALGFGMQIEPKDYQVSCSSDNPEIKFLPRKYNQELNLKDLVIDRSYCSAICTHSSIDLIRLQNINFTF